MTRKNLRITLSNDFDIMPLVLAIAGQAARQTKGGNRSAALWLATDGEFMLDCIGADRAAHKLGKLAREALAEKKTNTNPARGRRVQFKQQEHEL
jgi:hypothetical protein